MNHGFDGFAIAIGDIEESKVWVSYQVVSMRIYVILEDVEFVKGASQQILCDVGVRVEWGRRVCGVVFHLIDVNVLEGVVFVLVL